MAPTATPTVMAGGILEIYRVVAGIAVAVELRRAADLHCRRIAGEEASAARIVGPSAQLIGAGGSVEALPIITVGIGGCARAGRLGAIRVVAVGVGDRPRAAPSVYVSLASVVVLASDVTLVSRLSVS